MYTYLYLHMGAMRRNKLYSQTNDLPACGKEEKEE